jgi:nucleoside-diphosphate-sugar epimerase
MEKPKPRKRVSVVTGATSVLGNEIVKRLLLQGDEVRVLLKINPSIAESWHGIPSGVIPYVVDLTLPSQKDRKSLMHACRGADRVFHMAAAVYNYKNSSDTLMKVNVVGTENLLSSIAKANDAKQVHVVFASTVSVYGFRRGDELLTESSEVRPKTVYAKSKHIAEQLFQSYAFSNPNIRYTVLRLGTIYGKGYEKPSFCKVFRLISKGEMRYVGNGGNHMTLINVNDAVDALMRVSLRADCLNKVYNLTDGQPYTQKGLFSLAAKYMKAKLLGKSVHPIVARIGRRALGINIDEFEFLVSDRIISIERIRKDTGFSPKARMDIEGVKMIDACHD